MTIIDILAVLGALMLTWAAGGFGSLTWLWELPVLSFALLAALVVLFLVALWIWSLTVDLEKPVENEKKFDRVLIEQFCDLAMRVLNARIHMTGMEKLPKEGRFMLVCNHLSILDPVTLITCFRGRQLAFISKRENNTMPVVNKAMHRLQCQLINRENDREALKTILKCIDLIKEDKASVMAFPEGYTSMDGVLHEFRNGVFKIAQRTKVPVVVCTIKHTSKVFHNFTHFRRTHVYLDVVSVIMPDQFGMTTKDIGDQVHALMQEDIGDSVG